MALLAHAIWLGSMVSAAVCEVPPAQSTTADRRVLRSSQILPWCRLSGSHG